MVDQPLDRNAGLKPPAHHDVTGHGATVRRPHDETFDIIGPGHDLETVTEQVMGVVLKDRIRIGWVLLLGLSLSLLALLGVSVSMVLAMGVGVWGINKTVGWGFDIINFVWWIGIGHAGTLISAILLLVHQNWRTSINRFAEAMTIFAVMCAGLFPLLHLGRHQYFYWLAPLPNTMGMWPQFRSAAGVGLLRCFDLLHGFSAVLVYRPDSRPGDAARPCAEPHFENSLWHGRSGVARFESALASLHGGVSDSGRHLDAARAFGALNHLVRLRV
jgi:hypothetical protein